MSWRIRDPPSPVLFHSPEPEIIRPLTPGTAVSRSTSPPTQAEGEIGAYSPCPASRTASPDPVSRPVSPCTASRTCSPRPVSPQPSPPHPSSPPIIRLDLVGQEQWSLNPLQIKTTFSIIGDNDFQRLSSPTCGIGWSFSLDLCAATTSVSERIRRGRRWVTVQSAIIDPSVVVMHASVQSGLAGFPRGNYSIRLLFRREGSVLAVMENDWEDHIGSAIPLGHCNIPLPLGEIFIDLVVTLSFPDSEPSLQIPRTISASMSKAIRATLDGGFPVDVKFMLFSRKYGETFVCDRRPIYASREVLKGRNSFLDSYMNDSRAGDDHPPATHQYPYEEDSDLESDFDEEARSVPGTSDGTPVETLLHALPPTHISELDTAQPKPPKSRRGRASSVTSISDVDTDLPSEHSPAKSLPSCTDFALTDSICIAEDQQAVSLTCDVIDEPMGLCAEEYQADKVESQEKISASLPHLSLINDVAFRTFRALIVYMYTKEVAFIPLKSSGGRSYNIGDACSPKSMYRLAVKASHEGLKKHSFDNLHSQLGPTNIITEIFSKFTADYPEIFEVELKVLLDHFTNPVVQEQWERMIDIVASGRLPHGADVLKKVTRALHT
ncbi:hypothetical protein EDD18DRAFT_1139105 [Armillaria luteobubalina]|uniref:BTB domain-containing protein n=1 Tax=Armillaria luteobubalina TaxID=153913 RepID=A0AA39QFN0_9AGAR|nr:hypothetical protein EDD18DRAFT_1139105 [Armillaria luteobubalina]